MSFTETLTDDNLQLIRDFLAESCGIRIGDAIHHEIETGIARLMSAYGTDSVSAFLDHAAITEYGIRDQLVSAVISRESQWFRDLESYDFIMSELLPELEKRTAVAGIKALRFWSAGCSTGQEPYSLAIALHNHKKVSVADSTLPAGIDVIGTDVSPAALFLAISGRYNSRAMTGNLSDTYLDRYFDLENQVYCLKDVIRLSVQFHQHNLFDPAGDITGGPVDIVLLRYVLEFYTTQTQTVLLSHIADNMTPGGWLCLGKGETLPENSPFAPHRVDETVSVWRKP